MLVIAFALVFCHINSVYFYINRKIENQKCEEIKKTKMDTDNNSQMRWLSLIKMMFVVQCQKNKVECWIHKRRWQQQQQQHQKLFCWKCSTTLCVLCLQFMHIRFINTYTLQRLTHIHWMRSENVKENEWEERDRNGKSKWLPSKDHFNSIADSLWKWLSHYYALINDKHSECWRLIFSYLFINELNAIIHRMLSRQSFE